MTRKNKGEVWMRIPVFIISGIILYVWGFFIFCIAIAQFVLILLKGNREKEVLTMSNIYLVQLHIFIRYVTFLSDKRPFPFGELEKEIKKEK